MKGNFMAMKAMQRDKATQERLDDVFNLQSNALKQRLLYGHYTSGELPFSSLNEIQIHENELATATTFNISFQHLLDNDLYLENVYYEKQMFDLGSEYFAITDIDDASELNSKDIATLLRVKADMVLGVASDNAALFAMGPKKVAWSLPDYGNTIDTTYDFNTLYDRRRLLKLDANTIYVQRPTSTTDREFKKIDELVNITGVHSTVSLPELNPDIEIRDLVENEFRGRLALDVGDDTMWATLNNAQYFVATNQGLFGYFPDQPNTLQPVVFTNTRGIVDYRLAGFHPINEEPTLILVAHDGTNYRQFYVSLAIYPLIFDGNTIRELVGVHLDGVDGAPMPGVWTLRDYGDSTLALLSEGGFLQYSNFMYGFPTIYRVFTESKSDLASGGIRRRDNAQPDLPFCGDKRYSIARMAKDTITDVNSSLCVSNQGLYWKKSGTTFTDGHRVWDFKAVTDNEVTDVALEDVVAITEDLLLFNAFIDKEDEKAKYLFGVIKGVSGYKKCGDNWMSSKGWGFVQDGDEGPEDRLKRVFDAYGCSMGSAAPALLDRFFDIDEDNITGRIAALPDYNTFVAAINAIAPDSFTEEVQYHNGSATQPAFDLTIGTPDNIYNARQLFAKDSVSYTISSVPGGLQPGEIYLFTANQNDTPWRSQPCRIQHFAIKRGSTTLLDLVPVRVGTEYCMYDKEHPTGGDNGDGLYHNAGTGNFTGGADQATGTSSYDAEVEYLESTGTQYIKTGIMQADDLILECTFRKMGSTVAWGTYFGCGYSDNPSLNIIGRHYNADPTNFNPWFANTSGGECQVPVSTSAMNTVVVQSGSCVKGSGEFKWIQNNITNPVITNALGRYVLTTSKSTLADIMRQHYQLSVLGAVASSAAFSDLIVVDMGEQYGIVDNNVIVGALTNTEMRSVLEQSATRLLSSVSLAAAQSSSMAKVYWTAVKNTLLTSTLYKACADWGLNRFNRKFLGDTSPFNNDAPCKDAFADWAYKNRHGYDPDCTGQGNSYRSDLSTYTEKFRSYFKDKGYETPSVCSISLDSTLVDKIIVQLPPVVDDQGRLVDDGRRRPSSMTIERDNEVTDDQVNAFILVDEHAGSESYDETYVSLQPSTLPASHLDGEDVHIVTWKLQGPQVEIEITNLRLKTTNNIVSPDTASNHHPTINATLKNDTYHYHHATTNSTSWRIYLSNDNDPPYIQLPLNSNKFWRRLLCASYHEREVKQLLRQDYTTFASRLSEYYVLNDLVGARPSGVPDYRKVPNLAQPDLNDPPGSGFDTSRITSAALSANECVLHDIRSQYPASDSIVYNPSAYVLQEAANANADDTYTMHKSAKITIQKAINNWTGWLDPPPPPGDKPIRCWKLDQTHAIYVITIDYTIQVKGQVQGDVYKLKTTTVTIGGESVEIAEADISGIEVSGSPSASDDMIRSDEQIKTAIRNSQELKDALSVLAQTGEEALTLSQLMSTFINSNGYVINNNSFTDDYNLTNYDRANPAHPTTYNIDFSQEVATQMPLQEGSTIARFLTDIASASLQYKFPNPYPKDRLIDDDETAYQDKVNQIARFYADVVGRANTNIAPTDMTVQKLISYNGTPSKTINWSSSVWSDVKSTMVSVCENVLGAGAKIDDVFNSSPLLKLLAAADTDSARRTKRSQAHATIMDEALIVLNKRCAKQYVKYDALEHTDDSEGSAQPRLSRMYHLKDGKRAGQLFGVQDRKVLMYAEDTIIGDISVKRRSFEAQTFDIKPDNVKVMPFEPEKTSRRTWDLACESGSALVYWVKVPKDNSYGIPVPTNQATKTYPYIDESRLKGILCVQSEEGVSRTISAVVYAVEVGKLFIALTDSADVYCFNVNSLTPDNDLVYRLNPSQNCTVYKTMYSGRPNMGIDAMFLLDWNEADRSTETFDGKYQLLVQFKADRLVSGESNLQRFTFTTKLEDEPYGAVALSNVFSDANLTAAYRQFSDTAISDIQQTDDGLSLIHI